MRLPGGFSPTQALHTIADKVNPFDGTNTDYDVFGDISVAGGDRSPASGVIGAQRPAVGTSGQGGGGGGWGDDAVVQGAAQGQAASDPYARYGGQSGYNSLVSGFNKQLGTIRDTAGQAIGTAGRGVRSNILDFIDSYRTGQENIDEQGVQNELARQQGYGSILDMVGRGIRSGGVQLANRNAGDSSASGALARAYGDIGRRQLSQVGNQYELGNRNIAMDQENLGTQLTTAKRKFGEGNRSIVDNLVSDTQQKIGMLQSAMAEASLPDRIEISSEIEGIRNRALQELAQYDELLSRETGSIRPKGVEDRRREAQGLASRGRAPESAFNFTDEVPSQFQNSGPFASELPIFTLPRQRRLA